jgi:hypothetical protein
MIAKYYGKKYSLQLLRNKCLITREVVPLLGISEAKDRAVNGPDKTYQYQTEHLIHIGIWKSVSNIHS